MKDTIFVGIMTKKNVAGLDFMLHSILNQTYPLKKIALGFAVNDCEDTMKFVIEFLEKHLDRFCNILIFEKNFGDTITTSTLQGIEQFNQICKKYQFFFNNYFFNVVNYDKHAYFVYAHDDLYYPKDCFKKWVNFIKFRRDCGIVGGYMHTKNFGYWLSRPPAGIIINGKRPDFKDMTPIQEVDFVGTFLMDGALCKYLTLRNPKPLEFMDVIGSLFQDIKEYSFKSYVLKDIFIPHYVRKDQKVIMV